MQRTGIITLMSGYNYGGMLQCFALQETLRQLGGIPEVINYPISSKRRLLRRWGGRPATALAAWMGAERKLYGKFETFRRRELQLSRPVNTHAELARLSEEYSAVIAGSDQIWNQSWYAPEYYLDFAAPGVRRIAYAACCGADLPFPAWRRRELEKNLQAFDRISVRNRMTRDFVRNLTGGDPAVVADPTVLFDWPESPRPAGLPERYILLYAMSRNSFQLRREKLEKLAAELRLPLVAVYSDVLSPWLAEYGGERLVNPNVMEWMGALRHAECVFTDSFHGTVFALRNRKPLWNYIGSCRSFERIVDIVERYGIGIAYCEPEEVLRSLEAQRVPAYYTAVEKSVAAHREFSLNWLRKSFQ